MLTRLICLFVCMYVSGEVADFDEVFGVGGIGTKK